MESSRPQTPHLHSAQSRLREQLLAAQRESQLAELRSWTKDAYGKVQHAIRAEHQAREVQARGLLGGAEA